MLWHGCNSALMRYLFSSSMRSFAKLAVAAVSAAAVSASGANNDSPVDFVAVQADLKRLFMNSQDHWPGAPRLLLLSRHEQETHTRARAHP